MKGRLNAFAMVGVLGVFVFGSVSCNRPSSSSCKKAYENMTRVLGSREDPVEANSFVRSCRGNGTKKSVKCIIAAQSKEDLTKCSGKAIEDFREFREKENKKSDDDETPKEPK